MLTTMGAGDELFHTATGTAFADLVIDGHRETWPIRSQRFRSWLRRRYYQATGDALSAAALNAALNLFEARAQFDGPERMVHVRVAEHEGRIYLDLADTAWRAAEIGPRGLARHRGRRRCASAGLPACCRSRCRSGEDRSNSSRRCSICRTGMISSWSRLGCWPRCRHGGPYPLLVIAGEQGSAKTVLSKMLRALVDPNAAPVRTLPREERDLFIAANNGHVLAFDNLSALPPWLSDTLCRLASGGSFAVRQLYTDQDEVLFDAARPVILNGIEDVVSRPDLADRALFLTLPSLSEAQRRPEKELWREFELARPCLLGALLDAASHGLRALPAVNLDRLPRMADFALWATACETALWPSGTFAHVYASNRTAAIDDAIDADPVAACVRELMAERGSWTGSAADLLRAGADCSRTVFERRHRLAQKSPGARWPPAARADVPAGPGHRHCL